MNIEDRQQSRLLEIIRWAEKIHDELKPLLDSHGDRVHFRPSSGGVAMVGLLAEAPQLGKSALRNTCRVVREFEVLFSRYCTKPPKRVTGEKALQSFLIRDAYAHERKLHEVNKASLQTNGPVALTFVTDEIALPVQGKDKSDGKIVCDILALRADPRGGVIPVVMELKDERAMKRLIQQTTAYAGLMDLHRPLFEKLYSALLGEDIQFTASAEKWAVWPASKHEPDRREAEFASHGIRLVSYEQIGSAYTFHVGNLAI